MRLRARLENFFDGSVIQTVLSDLSYHASIERLGRLLIKRVVWRRHSGEPRIALTFDDGPHPVYTPQILDILKEHGATGTFFLIGRHVERFPEIARRIVREGHEIANHTYSHPLLMRLSDDQVKTEIAKTHQLLTGLNGQRPRFLRPPMGLFSKRILDLIEGQGYRALVGDVYPRDSHRPGKSKIVQRILQRGQAGSIIILHDGGNTDVVDRTQTVEAVREVIPKLKQRGFDLVTLSAMFDLN